MLQHPLPTFVRPSRSMLLWTTAVVTNASGLNHISRTGTQPYTSLSYSSCGKKLSRQETPNSVKKNKMQCMCEHSICEHDVWALYVWALYVWPLYVSTLCVTTLWEHPMCEHSMCDHSMGALYVWAPYVWALYVWALYVTTLYVSTLCVSICVSILCVTTRCVSICVSPLCVTTLCEHSMCDHCMWALYVSTLCHTTTTTKTPAQEHHHKNTTTKTPPQKTPQKTPSQCKHSMWALYVWPLYVSTLCEHSMCEHSMCDHSMWALYVRPKSTSSRAGCWHLVSPCISGRMLTPCMCEHAKSTTISTKSRLQFMGRMLQSTEKYENHHEKSTSVRVPEVAAPKMSKKHEFYCKNTVQEHWRTPKSTRITTKNEHRRSSSAEKVRKFTDETRFRPFQEHRRTPKSTRITTKNEHRRSWRAGNYENLQSKPAHARRRQAETTKIHRRNEHASTKPRK